MILNIPRGSILQRISTFLLKLWLFENQYQILPATPLNFHLFLVVRTRDVTLWTRFDLLTQLSINSDHMFTLYLWWVGDDLGVNRLCVISSVVELESGLEYLTLTYGRWTRTRLGRTRTRVVVTTCESSQIFFLSLFPINFFSKDCTEYLASCVRQFSVLVSQ